MRELYRRNISEEKYFLQIIYLDFFPTLSCLKVNYKESWINFIKTSFENNSQTLLEIQGEK